MRTQRPQRKEEGTENSVEAAAGGRGLGGMCEGGKKENVEAPYYSAKSANLLRQGYAGHEPAFATKHEPCGAMGGRKAARQAAEDIRSPATLKVRLRAEREVAWTFWIGWIFLQIDQTQSDGVR
jgi:hypothetical protein